jgi:uroporphyrinogen III methyltransferase/synthase
VTGIVFLVGAGPGDPGLLTLRGRDLLRSADVIVYDRLVNPVLLDHAPATARRIFAGKLAGGDGWPQERITATLVSHARSGRRVVRLKGGDPFVFGRGGEEAEALAAAGIRFEVVPGVSSAVAVPAYAGIPLTHRGRSSSFAVVTGHEAEGSATPVDWGALATAVDTLVVLMGLTGLPGIVRRLLAGGRPPVTPAALVRWGTTDAQVTVTGTLADIAERAAAAARLGPPVVLIVGDVVRLRERLAWFSEDPRLIDSDACSSEAASSPIRARACTPAATSGSTTAGSSSWETASPLGQARRSSRPVTVSSSPG